MITISKCGFCWTSLVLFSLTAASADTAVTPTLANSRIADMSARVSKSLSYARPLPRDLLAAKIEVRHIPAMPTDPEIIDRKLFGSDLPALKSALSEFRMDVASTTVEKNAFIIKLVLSGTRKNRVKYSSPMSLRFVVKNDVVIGLEAAQDPAERATLGEIAVEGGFKALPHN
jgi:hypothetical protein